MISTFFQKGYMTLMAIIVVSAMSTALAVALIFSSLSSSQVSLSLQDAKQAAALANLCAEEGLQILAEGRMLNGLQRKDFQSWGSCEFTLTQTGDEIYTIAATGLKDSSKRKVKVIAHQIMSDIHSQEMTGVSIGLKEKNKKKVKGNPRQIILRIQLFSWQEVADY